MAEEHQFSSSRPDNKRKFDDPSPAPQSYSSVPPPLDGIQLAKLKAQEIAAKLLSDAEAKRPRVDNGPAAADDYMQNPLGQQVTSLAGMSQPTSFTPYGYGTSKNIEIPNGRVGVIIGRNGDTIKQLQLQSGARIQVTRDVDADPNLQTRPVELMGTPEQISRAEQLINDVLVEADAGGPGALAARKVGRAQPGTEQFVMKIPNNKVGLIIGKGGETIKNMQANTGARIQVIPLHLPPGDTSTERTLQIDGAKEQLEAAKKLVNEIVSGENRAKNLNLQMGGGYPQQSYRASTPTNWGPQGGPPPSVQQQPGYAYAQPGDYQGAPQYTMPQLPYGGGFPPQPVAYSTGWDQSSTQGTQQTTTQAAIGYDYYSQQQQQQPTDAPGDNTGHVYGKGSYGDASYSQQQTYGYSQSASGYEQSQSYGSSAPPVYSSTTVNPTHGSGSGPTYAAPRGTGPAPPVVQPSQTQQGYVSQTGYSAPPTYGQTMQSQKPPAAGAQPVYGQPPTTQSGYAPPPAQSVFGQVPAATVQAGYAQPYQQVPPPYGGPPPSHR